MEFSVLLLQIFYRLKMISKQKVKKKILFKKKKKRRCYLKSQKVRRKGARQVRRLGVGKKEEFQEEEAAGDKLYIPAEEQGACDPWTELKVAAEWEQRWG